MYITSAKLKNIRAFKDLTLKMPFPDPTTGRIAPHTIIIGKNGTCKTSILRSIAIGLCREWDANALVAEPIGRLVREGSRTGTIDLRLSWPKGDGLHIITDLRNDGQADEDYVKKQRRLTRRKKQPPIPLVCGYGPARAVGEGIDVVRKIRIVDSAYSLFDYHQTMTSAELVLRRLDDVLEAKHFKRTLESIRDIIGLSSDDTIEVDPSGGVFFSGPEIGRRIPLDGLADGHRVALRWVLDMYGWAMRVDGALTAEGRIRGIALIDEIEQHLHPKLRNQLLAELGSAMPELQIIATTHSPIVAMNARPAELIVLHRRGRFVEQHDLRSTLGYSVEDILIDDELFDAPAYPHLLERSIRRYEDLATRKTLNPGQKTELRRLGRELMRSASSSLPEDAELEKLRRKHGL